MSYLDSSAVPLPVRTPLSEPFWAGLEVGELRLQVCDSCGTWRYPPTSPTCAACLSGEVRWEQASGRGRLWSWTVIHHSYSDAFEVPYVVALVELEEGPVMVSTIIGTESDDLRCDLPLQLEVVTTTAGQGIPLFRIAG
jgi:uncharacterized OB-fold protein